jgi:hypothetical protein
MSTLRLCRQKRPSRGASIPCRPSLVSVISKTNQNHTAFGHDNHEIIHRGSSWVSTPSFFALSPGLRGLSKGMSRSVVEETPDPKSKLLHAFCTDSLIHVYLSFNLHLYNTNQTNLPTPPQIFNPRCILTFLQKPSISSGSCVSDIGTSHLPLSSATCS